MLNKRGQYARFARRPLPRIVEGTNGMAHANTVVVRVTGAVLLIASAGLAGLVVLIVIRQFQVLGSIRTGVVVITIVFGLLSFFLFNVGYRLAFLRPNRYFSVLPPWGWWLLAALFGIGSVAAIAAAILLGSFLLVLSVAPGVAFAYGCIVAGKRASERSRDTGIVLPSTTALVNLEGFLPKDFRCGVEILNDTKTPMEFVVETLESTFQYEREAAVKCMLEIHHRGGILIPTDTVKEARSVADRISASAASLGHPLQCRAVVNE